MIMCGGGVPQTIIILAQPKDAHTMTCFVLFLWRFPSSFGGVAECVIVLGEQLPWALCLVFQGVWGRWLVLGGIHVNDSIQGGASQQSCALQRGN